MAITLKDLLAGLENASEVEKAIKQNLKENNCKLFVDDGEENIYVPKSRLDSKIAELKKANATIDELDTKIHDFENNTQVNEYAQKIKDLEAQIAQHNNEVKDIKINSALDALGKEMNVKDMEVLRKLIDLEKVDIDAAGQVKGLKEQVDALVESKGYLFGAQQNPNAPGFGGTGAPGKPNSDFVFGSKTNEAGSFGKQLAGQVAKVEEIGADYYFK